MPLFWLAEMHCGASGSWNLAWAEASHRVQMQVMESSISGGEPACCIMHWLCRRSRSAGAALAPLPAHPAERTNASCWGDALHTMGRIDKASLE